MKKTALALALTTAVVGTAMADGNWKTGTDEKLKSTYADCVLPGVEGQADKHCGHVMKKVEQPKPVVAPKPVVIAPPAPKPKPIVVAPVSFVLEADTSFATGSSKLKSSATTVLKDFATKAISANDRISKILIGGHADSVGKASFNMKLSQKRANSVRNYLVSQGVPASKVVATGYGETQPVASNATKAGRAKNRRAEVHIVTK